MQGGSFAQVKVHAADGKNRGPTWLTLALFDLLEQRAQPRLVSAFQAIADCPIGGLLRPRHPPAVIPVIGAPERDP